MREHNPESVDEARVLPHLRERSRLAERHQLRRQQAEVLDRETSRAEAEGMTPVLPRPGSAGGDRMRLRGIPVIGAAGGVSPGTQPERQATRGPADLGEVEVFLLHATARRRARTLPEREERAA
jgi:hypothetical protein